MGLISRPKTLFSKCAKLLLGSLLFSFEHLHVFIYLLVAPVKNPPVATSTTQPRSIPTFLSFVSLSFLVQQGFYCRHWVTYWRPWVTYWRPWVTYWRPWVSYWRRFLTHFSYFYKECQIILNNSSLFNTLNIQSWLIS